MAYLKESSNTFFYSTSPTILINLPDESDPEGGDLVDHSLRKITSKAETISNTNRDTNPKARYLLFVFFCGLQISKQHHSSRGSITT